MNIDIMLKHLQETLVARRQAHQCCMHRYQGVLSMVVPDGHVVLQCCECRRMETRHAEHVHEARP